MHPGYHAARHSAKLENVAAVYKTATSMVARLPPPWERSKRGRPPKLSSREYLAVCIVYVCLDLTYREVEGFAPAFLDETIDHSNVGKVLKRLKPSYVKLVLGLLRKRLKGHAEFDFYFVDSTGISTPRLKTRVKVLRKAREREFYKLHVLAGYSSRASALVIFAARVTKPNVTDGSQLRYLLRGLEGEGKRLLGDSAYDWRCNIELALKRGFKPLFKPRDVGYHGVFRKMVLRDFKQNKKLYRMRRWRGHFRRDREPLRGSHEVQESQNEGPEHAAHARGPQPEDTHARPRRGKKWIFIYSVDFFDKLCCFDRNLRKFRVVSKGEQIAMHDNCWRQFRRRGQGEDSCISRVA